VFQLCLKPIKGLILREVQTFIISLKIALFALSMYAQSIHQASAIMPFFLTMMAVE
jgi:hypothetical protein